MRTILGQAAVALAVVLLTIAAAAEPPSYTLNVEGLVCQLCAYSAKRNLSAIEGVEQVEIDYRTGEATVTMTEGAILDEVGVRDAIDAAGFTLLSFEALESSPQE